MSALLDWVTGLLLIVGGLFTLTASLGMLRLPDLYTRMHAASKAGTLGSCVMLLALALAADDATVSTRALAGVLFFVLTVPISSHLLAKAALAAGHAPWRAPGKDDADDPASAGRMPAPASAPYRKE
jgi:multicomponent Na+:H+ antiporter subunit G